MSLKSHVVTRCVFAACLSFATLSATAIDDRVRLAPEQVVSAGVVSVALADLKAGGSIRLPAQVVVPPSQIEVMSAPLPALVTVVRVAYGETVRKGQLLARLQTAQLVEMQRDLANARAQASLASENLRRDESLHGEGIIAQSRLSATRAAERQAAFLVAERRQALRLAGGAEPEVGAPVFSGSTTLRAPFDAVVLEATAQPGGRVDAMTPLFKLGRLTTLWLEIQAAPAQAAGIAVGDAVGIPGCAQTGRVKLVAPQMQAASQSLVIRAEVQQPQGCIKPFQYVQADILPVRPLAAGSWRLPPAALVRHQGQVWIFAVADGGFHPVVVKVVDETADAALVTSDLPPATRVAIKGVSTLKAAWLGLGAGNNAAPAAPSPVAGGK